MKKNGQNTNIKIKNTQFDTRSYSNLKKSSFYTDNKKIKKNSACFNTGFKEVVMKNKFRVSVVFKHFYVMLQSTHSSKNLLLI